jgi:hypothetical protein
MRTFHEHYTGKPYAINRDFRRWERKRAHHKVTKNTKPAERMSRAAHSRMSDSVGVAFGHAGKAGMGVLSPRLSLDLGRLRELRDFVVQLPSAAACRGFPCMGSIRKNHFF